MESLFVKTMFQKILHLVSFLSFCVKNESYYDKFKVQSRNRRCISNHYTIKTRLDSHHHALAISFYWSLWSLAFEQFHTSGFQRVQKESSCISGLISVLRQSSQMFFNRVVLKNFANFTGKHLCWRSNTGVFL